MANLPENFWSKSNLIKFLLFFVTVILVVLMFPRGESIESEVAVGSIWTKKDLIASITFEVPENPVVYKKKLNYIARHTPPVFSSEDQILKNQLDSLKKFKIVLLKSLDSSIVNPAFPNKTLLSDSTFQKLKQLRIHSRLITTTASGNLEDVFKASTLLLKRILRKGYLDRNLDDIQTDTISVRRGKFQRTISKNKFFDFPKAQNYISRYLDNNFNVAPDLIPVVKEIVARFLKPNLIFRKDLTEQEIKVAQEKIPRTKYIVNKNERIVGRHERITREIKEKIDAYRKARGSAQGMMDSFIQAIGEFLHITAIFSIFLIYLYLFRKKIFQDNLKLLLISVIILLVSFVTYLVGQMDVSSHVELLIFIPAASILFTIIFDSRLGFYGTVIISLLAGALRGNDYVFSLMNMVAGAFAVFSVRDIKNRTQIFRSFLAILVGYLISIVAFGMESFNSFEDILINSSFTASNALISPALAYGLIIFFEKLFKITTDLTLLELTDFNSPLLKELARNAPGTFNHSLTIGSMVEAAAEAIGANPILARVGAYYHDIGKLVNPIGFVENQMGKNIHEKLTPRESAQLIFEHVKHGIELAKENNLPGEIIDFIPMHHGTMVVSFFYGKAKELLGEEKVTEDEFRYPGPKPNTKETALVMLADACESTVRSMEDPDSKKVMNVITNIFNSRLEDGQLNDSPITFADLTRAKEIFLNVLLGQHHKRIRYPNQDEIENDSKDEKE